jgi:hypothetical protein
VLPAWNAQPRRTDQRFFHGTPYRVEKKKPYWYANKKSKKHVNMIQAHKATTINVFLKWTGQTEQTYRRGGIGFKTLEASLAVKNMKFNSVELSNNPRHVHIPQKPFLTALVKNLELRLMTVSFNLNSTANDRLADSSEYKLLLENMSVLMKEYWPFYTNGDYGPNQIRYLCERFDLEFEHNLSIFKLKLYSEG